MELIIAITGASGAVYACGLLHHLLMRGHGVHLLVSQYGALNLRVELGIDFDEMQPLEILRAIYPQAFSYNYKGTLRAHPVDDLSSPLASGSSTWEAMVIVPCSMRTLAAVAQGFGDNLIHRCADVALKERRRFILVPRETPLSRIHLQNMLQADEAGAVVAPAMPAFYHRPMEIQDLVDFMVGRILCLLGLEPLAGIRWKGLQGE
jgi:4-hydroxy-3-polyprenylbenzoate decarboxylase